MLSKGTLSLCIVFFIYTDSFSEYEVFFYEQFI